MPVIGGYRPNGGGWTRAGQPWTRRCCATKPTGCGTSDAPCRRTSTTPRTPGRTTASSATAGASSRSPQAPVLDRRRQTGQVPGRGRGRVQVRARRRTGPRRNRRFRAARSAWCGRRAALRPPTPNGRPAWDRENMHLRHGDPGGRNVVKSSIDLTHHGLIRTATPTSAPMMITGRSARSARLR